MAAKSKKKQQFPSSGDLHIIPIDKVNPLTPKGHNMPYIWMGNHQKNFAESTCNLWELRCMITKQKMKDQPRVFMQVDVMLTNFCSLRGKRTVKQLQVSANHPPSGESAKFNFTPIAYIAEKYSTCKLHSGHVPQGNGCRYVQITKILPKLWAFWIQMWHDFMSCSPLTVACTKLSSSNKSQTI